MRIYIICPIKKLTKDKKFIVLVMLIDLKKNRHEVRCPFRDTNQIDKIGLRIVEKHENGIIWTDKIYIW